MGRFDYDLEELFNAYQRKKQQVKKMKTVGYRNEDEEADALRERSAYGFDGTFRFRMWSTYNGALARRRILSANLPIEAIMDSTEQTHYHLVAGPNLGKEKQSGFDLRCLGDQEALFENAPKNLAELQHGFVLGIYTPRGAEIGGDKDQYAVMTNEKFATVSPEEYKKYVLGETDPDAD